MKEKIDTFWKKKENIVILIGVTVFLVVFMNYFYFHIIKSYENGPVRLVNTLISNAAENELKEGDIITSIDEKQLNTMNDLREYIYTKKPNEEVKLQVTRGKINKQINLTLGKK